MTTDELMALAAKAREHSDCLIHVNTRSQAVDWMANADLLLVRMAKQLEAVAKAGSAKDYQ